MFIFVSTSFAEERTATPKAQERDAAKMEEIVVTATRTEKELDVAPGSVNVVTKKDIEKRGTQTVDSALNTIPGVFNRRQSLADTLSSIALHGIPDQKRTLIMKDGIGINNAYDGAVVYTGLPLEDVERIEVVQGPFSSLYGGYAMGGVVNIITRMPEKREIIAKSGYGSSWHRGEAPDDIQKHYLSYGDKFKDRWSVLVSYSYRGTNGYSKDQNVQSSKPTAGITGWSYTSTNAGLTRYAVGDKGDNSFWDDNLDLKTGFDFSKVTKLNLSFMRTRYKYSYDEPHTYLTSATGNPVYTYGSVRENSYLSGFGGKEINRYNVRYETEFGPVKTKVTAGLNDEEKSWYTTPSSSAPYATIDGGPGKVSTSPNQNYNADLQLTFPVLERQIVTVGGSVRTNTVKVEEFSINNWKNEDSRTALTYNAGGKDRTYAVFLQDEIMILDNLTAYVGFREDFWETYDGYANQFGSAGYPKAYESRSASSFSPKLSLVYKPLEKTTLRASAGQAFRAPSVYELYRTWTSTTGVVYNGNPDLKPETVRSWDAGIVQGLWKGAKVGVTYFENYLTDLIYRKTVSTTQSDYINAGRAKSKGVILEAEQRFDKWLKLFVNYTYTDARINENTASPASEGKRMTFMPDTLFNAGAEFEMGPVSASVTGRYVGKRYGNDTNSDQVDGVYTSYDPFFTADAKVSYKVTRFATVSVSMDNILGETHFEYYRAPGRSYFAEVELRY